METQPLDILIYGDTALSLSSVDIVNFDDTLHKLLRDMHNTCNYYKAVGLSAPQVSKNLNVIVIHYNNTEYELINPKIIFSSKSVCSMSEGCLSVPNYFEHIDRPCNIKVEYKDRLGNKLGLDIEDSSLSHIIQHEIDHLNGVLFVDKLSRLKKTLFLNWYNKRVKMFNRIQASVKKNMTRPAKKKQELNGLYSNQNKTVKIDMEQFE